MRKAVLFAATLGVLLNAVPASAQSALQAGETDATVRGSGRQG